MSINPNPAPEPFPIWVVWREDQPAHGYFATEDIAKRATIDYWEEDEPVCPDYSWRRDGPRWELVVGGEHGGVYASRHLVYGGAPAAVSVVPPATNQTALLSGAERQFLTFALDLAFDRMVSDDGFTDEDEAALAKLRRLAAEATPVAVSPADANETAASVAAPVGRAAVLREVGWTECSPEWLSAHPGKCGTAPRVPGGPAVSHWHPQQAAGSCAAAEAPHAETPDAGDLAARLEAALTERFTELGNPFSEMRRHEQGPDGWPSSHPVGPHQVAEVLRELLATPPAVVAQPGKETDRG
ncbi:hypothetical protein [Streptomyces sp. AMCC400023]|uniref:hypothetical protein n=1 Tax=Streptomyces sp. AMCC400023 TaxID=2056258 RepID=UPI001F4336E0|nr:hypothetical protein [Streptomyces sp. AMCC400023]